MNSAQYLLIALTLAMVMTLNPVRCLGHLNSQSPSNFGKGLKSSNFQGWSDWLHKRSPSFGTDPWSSSGHFQQWNDWLAKRNLGSSMGSGFGSPTMFQKWNEWLAKRGLGSGPAEFGFGTPAEFQKWNDWMAKRSLDFGRSPFSVDNGQFQGWSEWLSKRMMPDLAKSGLTEFGSSKYLSPGLQDWRTATHKRQEGEQDGGEK